MWLYLAFFTFFPYCVFFHRTSSNYPALLFVILLLSFLFYLQWAHFFSSFYLTTPPLTHSVTTCLKWPHLPPLIPFVPILLSPFLLSPSALLPVSIHCLPTFSSNPITFSLLFILPAPFPTFSSYFSFYLPQIWKDSSASTLSLWHPFTLSSNSLFFLAVYNILTPFSFSTSLFLPFISPIL